jgi:hypothetical protein
MEGLEQLPWAQCQKHLEETESRLINEFSINQGVGPTQKIALTVIGLFVSSLLATWYFTSGTQKTVDLSPVPKESVSTAAINQPFEVTSENNSTPEVTSVDTASNLTQDKIVVEKESKKDRNTAATIETAIETEAETATIQSKVTPPVQKRIDDATTHITVGRIVDTRGIAIPNALVTSGSESDITDKSGYYALKIAKGGTQILVTHLETEYFVEIDTNQNWEIILDIAQQTVHDYYPMNAANRFK